MLHLSDAKIEYSIVLVLDTQEFCNKDANYVQFKFSKKFLFFMKATETFDVTSSFKGKEWSFRIDGYNLPLIANTSCIPN